MSILVLTNEREREMIERNKQMTAREAASLIIPKRRICFERERCNANSLIKSDPPIPKRNQMEWQQQNK